MFGLDDALVGLAIKYVPELLGEVFGDKTGEAAKNVAQTVTALTGHDNADKAKDALDANPDLVFQLRAKAMDLKAAREERQHQERMTAMANAVALAVATNTDRQGARDRDREFIKAGKTNTRANIMLLCAAIGIIGGIGFMVMGKVDGNTAVGGCIISVVSLLAGALKTAFDFDFGGSASEQHTMGVLAGFKK
ncbi:MAG: hypothetical protein H7Z12_15150 [Rhodospirillaceae bacterium]|nr:hypothetical protein [Rhodospirillales bacterium]